tara:strand:- start:141 stop:422 length:282 start_codon:yes stop_codon:yes gene_type:complete
MELRDTVTGITAAAVVGTGTIVGGGNVIDNMNDGPKRRREAELTELQLIVREEVRSAITEAWPKSSGPVTGLGPNPNGNYRDIVNSNTKKNGK